MQRLEREVARVAVCLATVAAVAGVAAAPALAASPPRGTYGCTIGGGYAGDLHILDGSHYRIDKGRKGTYRTRGHSINFVTGDWGHLFKSGRWYRARGTGGRWSIEIAMRDQTGFENTYCDKQ